jgi:aminocarboxymuconate-semialdehyde decarboxylase
MRYIDSFNHFFPKPLWDRMLESEGAARDIGKRMRGIPAIYDIDERLKIVDRFAADREYSQVISLGMPPLESLGEPAEVEAFAKLGNDGMAELVARHPDHFCGFLASLPMNSPNAAREAERAFGLGANGIQIHTNINGAPLDDERFFAVFETAARYGKPVFLHPSRGANDISDYKTETKSKYEIWWTFGWPYETSAALDPPPWRGPVGMLME